MSTQLKFENEIEIQIGNKYILGELCVPLTAKTVIIFSHGSGSSRHSPRNQQVAGYLQRRGFGTLLLDLLTFDEDEIIKNRFNIRMLADRLHVASRWISDSPITFECNIAYFGASTGAASALVAASETSNIKAIVCRGGRPDLAESDLSSISAPTLLIVGGLDPEVIKFNQAAWSKLHGVKKLEIIPGASHLFEEPGKMDLVCESAYEWFNQYTS